MEENNFNELITSYRQNLEFNKPDDELISAINLAIKESQELKNIIDKRGEKNKIIWQIGTLEDLSKVHIKKAKVVINRIFTDVETAIPILSANTPEPTVLGEVSNDIKEKIQNGLKIIYEVNYKMQQKIQCLTRHWFIYLIGILKYRWDKDLGFVTENVLPLKVGIDKKATCKENCEYIWEELEENAENLKKKFPEKSKEISEIAGKDQGKSKIKYFEFWGGNAEWVCWVIPGKNIILGKKKNPNFDYETPENNIFENPQFPYLFLNVLNLGDNNSLYDNTSLIEEATASQEGVNRLEQQIIELNEGQKRVWVTSGEAMSEKKAQDLVNKTGDLMVYLDRKAPVGGLGQVQSGKPDASLFNNLSHLLSEIDNIFGIHSTTRGERAQQETATGRQLLLGSDIGRMDMIVRNIEQVAEEWYNAYLHMTKVYTIEEVSLYGEKDKVEIVPTDIPSNIKVMVKRGSTLPTDDYSRMQMAQQLAGAGMIDPKTLFEEMGYGNIEQRVNDLYQWLTITGRINPQAVQQTAQGNTGQGGEQLTRLQDILQSPQFQQLPPEEQQQFIQQGRQIVETIKGGTQ